MKLIAIILTAAALAPSARGDEAHWLDATFSGMGGWITLNGFPILETAQPDSGFVSQLVTGMLVDGENTLAWSAVTPASTIEQELPATASIQLFAADPESPRPQGDPGRPLFETTLEPRRKIDFFPAADEFLTALVGTLESASGPARFEMIAERRFALGLSIGDPSRHVAADPVVLRHARLSDTLVLAELHLVDSINHRQVVFPNLKFLPGGGSVDLARENAGQGRHHLGSGTFDQLWIFGSAAEGIESVDLGMLGIESFATSYAGSETIELETPHRWAWQDGEDLGEFPPDDPRRGSLLAFLKELHTTVSKPDPEEWRPFFQTKIRDLARATGREPDAMAEDYFKFFKTLTTLDEWDLEPLAPGRLFIVGLNQRVLRVRYVDSEGPLISVPLPKPGEGTRDRFSIPLYLSLIDGEWTIVR